MRRACGRSDFPWPAMSRTDGLAPRVRADHPAQDVRVPGRATEPVLCDEEGSHEWRSARDLCSWEERLLGHPGTLRRTLTIPVLIMLGAGVAYAKIDHATQPRKEQAGHLRRGRCRTWRFPSRSCSSAEKRGEASFHRLRATEEFLLKHGLAEGVLIIRVRSRESNFLYDAFPPLRDRNTFSTLTATLPDLVSDRGEECELRHRVRVYPLPVMRLSSRSAAEGALDREFSPRCEGNAVIPKLPSGRGTHVSTAFEWREAGSGQLRGTSEVAMKPRERHTDQSQEELLHRAGRGVAVLDL